MTSSQLCYFLTSGINQTIKMWGRCSPYLPPVFFISCVCPWLRGWRSSWSNCCFPSFISFLSPDPLPSLHSSHFRILASCWTNETKCTSTRTHFFEFPPPPVLHHVHTETIILSRIHIFNIFYPVHHIALNVIGTYCIFNVIMLSTYLHTIQFATNCVI